MTQDTFFLLVVEGLIMFVVVCVLAFCMNVCLAHEHVMHHKDIKVADTSRNNTKDSVIPTICLPVSQPPLHYDKLGQSIKHMQHMAHKPKKNVPSSTSMHDPISPWKHPKIQPSPPHTLVGKQMGVITTPGIAPLGYEMDGKVKVFRLTAQPIEQYLTDGKAADYEKLLDEKNKLPEGLMHHTHPVQKLRAWGVNGSTPGPTIEAHEGDTVRMIVTNELPEPMSVHWHGLEIPNSQDGVGMFTQPVIMPGDCRTYQFTLYQSGTYIYHGGFNRTKEDLFGLTGAFVIHPKKYKHKIDKQFVITLQEWKILPGNIYPNLMSMDFNWFTFNGKVAPSIPALMVNQYERIRIRFINMSMGNHPIHFHGYTGWIVGTEAGPIPQSAQWPANTIDIPPGGTRDVEFEAWNPGIWLMHCHKIHHVLNAHADVPMGIMPHGGMFTVIYVKPHDPKAPWQHYKQTKGKQKKEWIYKNKKWVEKKVKQGAHHAH